MATSETFMSRDVTHMVLYMTTAVEAAGAAVGEVWEEVEGRLHSHAGSLVRYAHFVRFRLTTVAMEIKMCRHLYLFDQS